MQLSRGIYLKMSYFCLDCNYCQVCMSLGKPGKSWNFDHNVCSIKCIIFFVLIDERHDAGFFPLPILVTCLVSLSYSVPYNSLWLWGGSKDTLLQLQIQPYALVNALNGTTIFSSRSTKLKREKLTRK